MPTRVEEFLQSEERRAKKIEALVALLRDPEMSDVVGKLLGETPRAGVVSNGHTGPPIQASNGHSLSLPKSITAAIREIGPKLPKPFTIHDAVDVLTAHGYQFSRKAVDMVRDSLYFIVREANPKFRVTEAGSAGKLSKYEYVG